MALILLRTACGRKLQAQRGSGATIVTVPGGNGAATTREAAVEILALNIFGIADRDGLLVTRRMVDKRLAEARRQAAARLNLGVLDIRRMVRTEQCPVVTDERGRRRIPAQWCDDPAGWLS